MVAKLGLTLTGSKQHNRDELLLYAFMTVWNIFLLLTLLAVVMQCNIMNMYV